MLLRLFTITMVVFISSCGQNATPKPDPKLDFNIVKKDEIEVVGRLLDKKLNVDCVKEQLETATDLLFH